MKSLAHHLSLPLAAICCLGLWAAPAQAADFADPTWPCVQRKVENLSPGLMWPHPMDPITPSPETRAAMTGLVDLLVLRRIPVEELQPPVEAFVADHGADPALLGQVFSEAFKPLARMRGTLIRGIEKYSLKQIALSDKIDATRARMDMLMAAENPDFDQVDSLEEQLDWDERIFTERKRSLTHVCDSPVLIEKRLYAIAQLLQAQLAD